MAQGDTGELKAPEVSAEPAPQKRGTGELKLADAAALGAASSGGPKHSRAPSDGYGAPAAAPSSDRHGEPITLVQSESAERDAPAPSERQPRVGLWRTASALLLIAVIALLINDVFVSREARAIAASYQHTVAHLVARQHQLGARLVAANAQVAAMRVSLAESAQMMRIAAQPDFRLIELNPLKPAPAASGFVTESYRANTAAVRAVGLPETPPGKTYELWWITRAHGPIQGGLFLVGASGVATATATLPPRSERIVASAITLEPAGGAQKPTGAMYMMGSARSR